MTQKSEAIVQHGLWLTKTFAKITAIGHIIGYLECRDLLPNTEGLWSAWRDHEVNYLLERAQELANDDSYWATLPESFNPTHKEVEKYDEMRRLWPIPQIGPLGPWPTKEMRERLRFLLTLCDQDIR